jgi:hypothetical protein
MTDERQVRSLLTLAAELPDEVQPPVGALLRRARRKRRVRAVFTVVTAVVLIVAAFALPPAIRGLSHGSAQPIGMGVHGMRGPTATQLTHFHWSSLPPSPYNPGSNPLLTWTGRELLVIPPSAQRRVLNPVAYDAATREWHEIFWPPRSVGLAGAVTVWTGHELFVTNDKSSPVRSNSDLALGAPAGLYDPVTNHWATTALPRQMLGASQLAAVWTGHDVILGAVSLQQRTLWVAAYEPRTGRWRMITPTLPADHPPVALAMVATPSRVILWSLWSKTTKVSSNGYAVASGVDVLSLGGNGGWSTITRGWPQHKTIDNPVYAAGQILVPPSMIWCGLCSNPGAYFRAELADAGTLARRTIPSGPLVVHPNIQPPIWLWNGGSALAANVHTSPFDPGSTQREWLTQMAAFNPSADSWSTLPVPAGKPPIAANPIWAGRQLLLLTARGGLLSFHA